MGIREHPRRGASSRKRILPLLLCAVVVSGCAPRGIFYWGGYEDSLYQRYIEQDSAQAEVYLRESIADAEQNNYRVPPGVYADYGFLLYRRGDKRSAVAYFSKEKQIYPESSALMSKLIERVRLQLEQEPKEPNPAATEEDADEL